MCLTNPIEAQDLPRPIIPDSVSHQSATFGEILKQSLARSGLSQEGFARAVGAVGPHVNLIIKGKRTPPLDRLDAWADALGLSPEERRTFKFLAGLAHIPDQGVRDLVADELATLRAEVAALRASLLDDAR